MSSVLSSQHSAVQSLNGWLRWAPIGVGLLALYGPTLWTLGHGLWTQEEHMHGPIVLAVVIWLFWQSRDVLAHSNAAPRTWLGGVVLSSGLLLYILGRSQDIILFEVGSLIPVLGGVLLVMVGSRAVWQLKFALGFIVFMLPLPGVIVDAWTGTLKHHVSAIAEYLLYTAGYPIARSGVILSVGPYQLLVADACSGLHSLISMSAMGLLYIFLMGHKSIVRNAILVACLLPIAFAANVIRVIVLVLVTFHFGDAAGQGFIHDFSGVFLFTVGLLLLFAIDGALGRVNGLQKVRQVDV